MLRLVDGIMNEYVVDIPHKSEVILVRHLAGKMIQETRWRSKIDQKIGWKRCGTNKNEEM